MRKFYKQLEISQAQYEKKFTSVEKKRSNALEMATQENEKRKKKEKN
jgi:hypothetical protein